MGLPRCYDCRRKISTDAETCPHCGRPRPTPAQTYKSQRAATAGAAAPSTQAGKPGSGDLAKSIFAILVCFFILAALISILPHGEAPVATATAARSATPTPTPAAPKKDNSEAARRVAEKNAVRAAELQRETQSGFHCLSKWDGAHNQLKSLVKERLRNPRSFEHVETRITPNKDGMHTIVMTFRAENGFGGINVSTAIGTVRNSDCAATLLSVG